MILPSAKTYKEGLQKVSLIKNNSILHSVQKKFVEWAVWTAIFPITVLHPCACPFKEYKWWLRLLPKEGFEGSKV